jgi:thymidine phosphorylase
MIEQQGGDPRVVDHYALLPAAPDREMIRAPRTGYVTAMRAEAIGRASHALGAGRTRAGEAIDHGVGIVARAKTGDAVAAGDVLLELHHRGGRGVDIAVSLCREAIAVEDEPPPSGPLILGFVGDEGTVPSSPGGL